MCGAVSHKNSRAITGHTRDSTGDSLSGANCWLNARHGRGRSCDDEVRRARAGGRAAACVQMRQPVGWVNGIWTDQRLFGASPVLEAKYRHRACPRAHVPGGREASAGDGGGRGAGARLRTREVRGRASVVLQVDGVLKLAVQRLFKPRHLLLHARDRARQLAHIRLVRLRRCGRARASGVWGHDVAADGRSEGARQRRGARSPRRWRG